MKDSTHSEPDDNTAYGVESIWRVAGQLGCTFPTDLVPLWLDNRACAYAILKVNSLDPVRSILCFGNSETTMSSQ